MFGRKKKQDDPLGLSSIGSTASVAPSASPTPAVSPVPADPAAVPSPPAPPKAVFQVISSQGGAPPAVFTGGMQFGATDMLKQMIGARGPISDLIKEIQSDPQAFRAKMMAQAQAAGVSTMVMTPQGFQQAGAAAGAPAPSHVDVVEELTKAADLHDKGVLTDAEFEALKHKLLGH